MSRIPLALRLRRKRHRDIAAAQDLIVGELYRASRDAVIHGGTAIWRCYGGNRFSEDIDVYMPKDKKALEKFFQGLKKSGLVLKKKKMGDSSLYSRIGSGGAIVRFEALFKSVGGVLGHYETADGNYLPVYTLTPEQLIGEKVSAYLKRRKIRDLYDIFFLLKQVKEPGEVSEPLERLLGQFKNPVDEKELRVLIIEGLVPDVEKMLEYIRRWAK